MAQEGFFLLKFGEKQFMEQLLYEGTIFCRTLEGFKIMEDGKVRGDKHEGVAEITNLTGDQIKRFEIKIPGKPPITSLNPKAFHLKEYYDSSLLNLYCMYVTNQAAPQKLQVNTAITQFGNYCVIFHDSQSFHDRMRMKLKELNKRVDFDAVSYYNEKSYNGKLGWFNKCDDYSWQKEYRFLIEHDVDAPLIFNLGSLTDIAELQEYKGGKFQICK